MVNITHIDPVSDFVRNFKAYLDRIRETGQPEALTVKAVAECVPADAKSYREMQEALEKVRFIKDVNEGIENMNSGAGKPAVQAFSDIRELLGL